MKNYKEFLAEGFKNLFSPKDKKPMADEVWEILQNSYAPIGGIKGNGFKSVDDMIKNIPMWKLGVRDGKVKAVIMYKDKKGRKSIAAGTDRSKEGKTLLLEMVREDFKRSFGEKSGPMLNFVKKNLPELVKQYAIPAKEVHKYIDAEDIVPVDKYEYKRKIGGTVIQKMLLGTPGKTIV